MSHYRLATILLALASSACTSQQLYNSSQAWRRQECNKVAEQDAKDRCVRDAYKSYDSYQKESSAAASAAAR